MNYLIFTLTLFIAQNVFSCDEVLRRFPEDCQIQDEYRDLKKSFQNLNIEMDEIAEYKAIRFIGRHLWEKAKTQGNADPKLVYHPAPSVWEVWLQGEKASREITVKDISIKSLEKLHGQAMTEKIISKFAFLKGTRPGKIRSSYYQIAPGFRFGCQKKEMRSDIFYKIHDHLFDLVSSSGRPLLRLMTYQLCYNGDFWEGSIRYIGSSLVPEELQFLIDSLNTDIKKSYSPIAILAKYQRWFVALHPFGDGNGRMSRFLQDILSRHYDLPYVPAGDLKNELVNTESEYLGLTRQAVTTMLNTLKICLKEHQRDPASISPACRILP